MLRGTTKYFANNFSKSRDITKIPTKINLIYYSVNFTG